MSDLSGDLWIRDEYTPEYFWYDIVAVLLLTTLGSCAIVLLVTKDDIAFTYELDEYDWNRIKKHFFKL